MEQKIYQGGFYLLLGIIFGGIVSFFITRSAYSYKPQPVNVEITVKKDSVISSKITQKTISYNTESNDVKKKLPELNELNLRKELAKYNIRHKDIIVAQAKLESNLGKSKLAKTHNNIFGLRGSSGYRRFSHWTESVAAYNNLIYRRYMGGDYYDFLEDIGYAEDPSYTNKLKSI